MKHALHFAIIATFLTFFSSNIFAQTPDRVSIKGIVIDTSGELLPFSTAILMNAKDSSLIAFKQGDDKGVFEFSKIKNQPYILKIFFSGYIPTFQNLAISQTTEENLGKIKLKIIAKELMEVVVKTAKSTLTMRGDTMEYNAAAFQVPPGSTVEDLLRRLPGIDVDADGNISTQGKAVNRLYVDGKSFFGADPKAATKNLDANIISKVQVFNEKSEQSKLTGVDDGKKEKAMNLELKDQYKKGKFGKITAAAGTEERWAARGNFNQFNKKEQFSVIGFANNINETGVNWDDYSEFKGQNTWGGQDSGDFGFRGGGGNRWLTMGNGVYMNNFDGRGFTKNGGVGTNYNFDNKKRKFNGNYFFNQTRLNLEQFAERQNFLADAYFLNTDTLKKTDFRQNHSFSTRLEQEIDSMNTVIVKADFRFTGSQFEENNQSSFSKNGTEKTNELNVTNKNENDTRVLNSLGIFRHKFKKKGRSFAASTAYSNNATDAIDNILSINDFFKANTFTEQVRYLNQNGNNTKSQQVKSSVLFTEALSKKLFVETFYNFANTQNEVSRPVTDPEKNNKRIDSLSIYFKNDILYNRFGSTFRYAYEGVNLSAGLAAQQLQIGGSYARSKQEDWLEKPLQLSFFNVVPFFESDIEFENNFSTNFGYSYQVNEPRISDLQPVPNINNPAFKIEGNPKLTPERSHNVNGSLNYWNNGNNSHAGIEADFKTFDNRIVYSQVIENIDRVGLRTTTKPINVNAGNSTELSFWSGFPLIKGKWTMNLNGSLLLNNEPAFVNNIENNTKSTNTNVNAGFNITPNPKIIAYIGARMSQNNIRYSISPDQNQIITNNSLNANIKWSFLKKTFLETNFAYTSYQNKRFGFDRKIPIWNASIRQLIGEKNKVELRLAIFDIFNKRLNISQFATQNYVTRSEAPTLARYVMLSLAYNMKGYDTKLKKGWF